jgi:hypothetical protein
MPRKSKFRGKIVHRAVFQFTVVQQNAGGAFEFHKSRDAGKMIRRRDSAGSFLSNPKPNLQ